MTHPAATSAVPPDLTVGGAASVVGVTVRTLHPWDEVGLARSYVDDPGFRSFYDDIEPGLADWLRAVVDANALARGVDPATATWV